MIWIIIAVFEQQFRITKYDQHHVRKESFEINACLLTDSDIKVTEVRLPNDDDINNREIPALQKLFDRPFLWLIVGFITMAAFYTIWGIFEIYTLPMATLP